MSTSPKWKAQPRRLRGRLGIDVAAQSPTYVVLPPLGSPRHAASPRHVSLERQQQDELAKLRYAFHERIETTRALVDLSPLQSSVNQAIGKLGTSLNDRDLEDGVGEASCFVDAKRVCSRLEDAPFLSQFLLELIHSIEQIVHSKRQQESSANPKAGRPIQAAAVDGDTDVDEGSISSESPDENSSEEEQVHDEDKGDLEEVCAAAISAPEQEESMGTNLRHARATDAVFRTTLRSRNFPPSRVPPCEHIQKTTSHLPFNHLKRRIDLASLQLKGHDEYGSAQWSMVLFPKSQPSLTNQDEFDAFAQWAELKQSQLAAPTAHGDIDFDNDEEVFENARRQFTATLEIKELLCFELSRFIFDKCPTTARFLHRLFVELVEVALLTLANAEREHDIMEQRHKNVQLELSRLKDKLAKVQASLASVEATLTKRQHMLLRERERIIRKRKKLNMLLGADQILIRRVAGLISCAQEIGDELLLSHKAVATGSTSAAGNALSTTQHTHYGSDGRFTALDEIVSVVVDKYQNLPQVAGMRERETSSREPTASTSCADLSPNANPSSNRDLIVLDATAVTTALEEYKATHLRLSRMMSTKSPDSSVGWDAQELWDQALFIPPHEDIQDLERDVQRLILAVEERILHRRHQRTRRGVTTTVSVQTDLSACTPKVVDQHQRWRGRQFAQHTAIPPVSSTAAIKTWNWRQLTRTRRKTNERRGIKNETTAPRRAAAPTLVDRPSTRDEDHRNLLKTLVPDGFHGFIRSVPTDYAPQQLDLHQVHNLISYLFNGVWMLVQEDFHRPPGFSTTSMPWRSDDARLIPLATFHEYIYRIFLQHFHIESVVMSRILDLLLSASRLDTQSCKVQLFCRLLGLAGVTAFSSDGFWFVLKALHVLQRCCGSSGGYFLLDGEGDNEFVPQASATEAISQLFAGSSNEVLKRLRLKLSGLASVFGAVWIPAYNVLTIIMDEWKSGQDALLLLIEEKLFLEHGSELEPCAGKRNFGKEGSVVSFTDFLQGFQVLKLPLNRCEAVHAYRQLLLDSTKGSASAASSDQTVDWHRFSTNWIHIILHEANVSQQQILRSSNAYSAQSSSVFGPTGGAIGPGVQLGSISDAMVAANQNLSLKFLVASWEQMKPEIIRRLDSKFNDVGLQVRLVQQMQTIIVKQPQLPLPQRDSNSAWRSFHLLIDIAFSSMPPSGASASL